VEIDPGKRIEKSIGTAYGEQASGSLNEVEGRDAKVEIQGNPIMVPQELEADVPASGAGGSERPRITVQHSSTIYERKTPMAELGIGERELGENHTDVRRGDIASPNSETNRDSIMGRGRMTGSSSPTVSEPTWSPSTTVQRTGTRGSRFEER